MRLTPPRKAAAGSCSRTSPHPPPAPQGAGAQGGPPALLFSFGRDILFARGTSPKLAFKLDHAQHVVHVSLSLTKYSVLYNDRVSLRAPRSLYTISTKQIILYNSGDARTSCARAARQPPLKKVLTQARRCATIVLQGEPSACKNYHDSRRVSSGRLFFFYFARLRRCLRSSRSASAYSTVTASSPWFSKRRTRSRLPCAR